MKRTPLTVLMLAMVAAGCGAGANPPVQSRAPVARDLPSPQPASFVEWRAGFRQRALAQGIRPDVFDAAFAGVGVNAEVVRLDGRQAEFTKQIWEYLDSAASPTRVETGRAKAAELSDTMAAIEARYGVDPQAVLAIWGMESNFGANRGTIPVVESLATLAYEGRRRSFAEEQLVGALRILQSGDVDPSHMVGSWAGAMGHTQFIPTSYLSYAQDFTGDGRRDVWSDNPRDALASAANYLAKSGWKKGAPWAIEVTLPEGFDWMQVGSRTQRPMAQWAGLGVATVDGKALPDGWAALTAPAGARGPVFLIFDNFGAIETYNMADAYVFAVGHLADRLRGGAPFTGTWPRDLRALSYFERREVQERLTALGHDTGGVDAKMGPRTLAAIRSFQNSRHERPDGYPGLPVLEALRQADPAH